MIIFAVSMSLISVADVYGQTAADACFDEGYNNATYGSFNQTQNELCWNEYYNGFIDGCMSKGNENAACVSIAEEAQEQEQSKTFVNETKIIEDFKAAFSQGQGDCAPGELNITIPNPFSVTNTGLCIQEDRIPIILGEMKRQQEAIK